MKTYKVNIFMVIDTIYDIKAETKKEALKKAQEEYCSLPLYDGNDPVKFEVEEQEEDMSNKTGVASFDAGEFYK